jgi:hypothetical protein
MNTKHFFGQAVICVVVATAEAFWLRAAEEIRQEIIKAGSSSCKALASEPKAGA